MKVRISERWQYRIGDKLKQRKAELNKQIEAEKKKIEDYGKNDTSKLERLKAEYADTATPSEYLEYGRKGIKGTEDDAWYRDKAEKALNSALAPLAPAGSLPYNPNPAFKYNKDSGMYYGERQPKNKDMHDRINRRTKKYDTTNLHNLKHEAACILIEALNTLLNE